MRIRIQELFDRDPEGKNSDPGSGINILDPQHCTENIQYVYIQNSLAVSRLRIVQLQQILSQNVVEMSERDLFYNAYHGQAKTREDARLSQASHKKDIHRYCKISLYE
jgi:hypothetical protein